MVRSHRRDRTALTPAPDVSSPPNTNLHVNEEGQDFLERRGGFVPLAVLSPFVPADFMS
jgi:hypothetical protein